MLVVQSAGNLPDAGAHPYLGVKDHLVAGRTYPEYLNEPSCRVANPGQSLQALTVGSVGYGAFEAGGWRTFANDPGHPSSFSRSGFGIWNVIKPEVVEFGGDGVRTQSTPPDVKSGGHITEACPELVRSTLFPPGPAIDRDRVGTSFAAPKVTRIAARLQQLLPDESALRARALIVQFSTMAGMADQLLGELKKASRIHADIRIDEKNSLSKLLRSCVESDTASRMKASNSGINGTTTFISSGECLIRPRECHIYQVPIPAGIRGPADEYETLMLTLSASVEYAAHSLPPLPDTFHQKLTGRAISFAKT